jgi:23S rRNA (cytidine1920-2'-O)/16S rRNA (cytidine1409-2'-O)-methyltransferase
MLAREDEFEFSRAYEKIKAFDRAVKLRSFFEGKKVLDVGSSTGGFTKFALEKGAREVLAVELGTKQMEPVLALDKRVKLNEKTDIFEVGRSEKSNSGFKLSDEISDVNMVVMDVSFVSARRVLNHLKNDVLNKGVEIVLLLKPQFEVGGVEYFLFLKIIKLIENRPNSTTALNMIRITSNFFI